MKVYILIVMFKTWTDVLGVYSTAEKAADAKAKVHQIVQPCVGGDFYVIEKNLDDVCE